jgi:four helix bundle protein
MKYRRFGDLPVWQTAIELGREVYTLTEDPAFQSRYSLRDQIERAAVSLSNNIAEGFEERHQSGIADVYLHCPGSAGEVRSMLCLVQGMPLFRNLESATRNLRDKTESISRQLGAWARSLHDSDSKGRRYVNQKVRSQAETKHRREEFLRELEDIRAGAKRLND